MLSRTKTVVAGLATAAMLATASLVAVPAQAQPIDQGYVQNVAWNGPGWNMRNDRNRGGNWNQRNHRGGGNNWVAPLVGGLVIGGIIAQSANAGSRDAYCHAHFRTYRSATGTYTGYDGLQHRC